MYDIKNLKLDLYRRVVNRDVFVLSFALYILNIV